MSDEKLDRVISLLFKQTKAPEGAKDKLKQRLFCATELSDKDLHIVTAAGDLASQKLSQDDKNK